MAVLTSQWEAVLDELLTTCERRAGRAQGLPHCAICARYAAASPAFEGVLSLLETLPAAEQGDALATAAARLAAVPAGQRGQQVTAANFGPLLDSPGWPLVRSLVIDLGSEDTARFLAHPRLAGVEELTLLGFAYGNAVAGAAFTAALLGANLPTLRALTLHSTDLADEDLAAFWASPFAARLDRIAGVAYRGEALPHALAATEIQLPGAWDRDGRFDYLLRLIAPGATPHLRTLRLGTYYAERSALGVLELLEGHRREFERIAELEVAVYGRNEATEQRLRTVSWPATMKAVSWSWHSGHGTIVGLDGDTHRVYRPDAGEGVAGCDTVTHYPGLAVELAHAGDLSRSLVELKLIAPPAAALAELLAAVGRFDRLTRLCVVYPFSEAQLPRFLAAVEHVAQVEVYLTMKTGCFTTQYRKEHEDEYRSDVSPRFLLETVAAGRQLSIYSDALEVSRGPSGFEHVTAKTDEAVRELAAFENDAPVESLTIGVTLSARAAKALAGSTLLGRTYRLNIEEGFADEAAVVLAGCPQLRGVRVLRLTGFRTISAEGFAAVIGSPHLAGVLDLSLGHVPDGSDRALAASPLLPRLVALDLYNDRKSDALPASGRLRSLRRISEWLSMSVSEDGRLARKWLTAGVAVPFRAQLRRFVDWVYRVPGEPLDELLTRLEHAGGEDDVKERLRDVVARAFAGTPVPDGVPFTDLNAERQAALRSIIRVDGHYWCVSGLLRPVFESYGLPGFERVQLERYVAGKNIWGHDGE